jgi:hypothetical protein
MGSPSAASICAIQVEARLYQLWVGCCTNDGQWTWQLRNRQGEAFQEGQSESKIAAQVASQLAFERRLNLSGLSRTASSEYNGYRWSDVPTGG